MMSDLARIGADITVVGSVIQFGAIVFGIVAGVSAGPYGSLPVAAVLSGIGLSGLVAAALGFRGRLTEIVPSRAQNGGLSCFGASLLVANPLPGTPLPFGQTALVGAAGMALGGVVLLVTAIGSEEAAHGQ